MIIGKFFILFLYFYLINICSLLLIVSAVVAISDIMNDESTQLVSLTQLRPVNAQTEIAGLNTEKTSRCSNTKCQNEIIVLRHILEQLQLSESRLLRYTGRR